MTRQNVTDGPREILTRKCPTCAGDGIVYSERSAAIDAERKLRALAPRAALEGVPGRAQRARRLARRSAPAARASPRSRRRSKKRFFIEGAEDVPVDFFAVIAGGHDRGARARGAGRGGRDGRGQARRDRQHDATRGDRRSSTAHGLRRRRREVRRQKVKVEIVRSSTAPPTRRSSTGAGEAGRADHGGGPGREADARAAQDGRREAEAGEATRRRRGRRPRPSARRRRRGASRRGGGAEEGAAEGEEHAEEEDAPRLARRPRPQEEAGDGGRARRPPRRRRRRGAERPSAEPSRRAGRGRQRQGAEASTSPIRSSAGSRSRRRSPRTAASRREGGEDAGEAAPQGRAAAPAADATGARSVPRPTAEAPRRRATAGELTAARLPFPRARARVFHAYGLRDRETRRQAVPRPGGRADHSSTACRTTRTRPSSRTCCSWAATARPSSRRRIEVTARIVGHGRGAKIRIGKYRAEERLQEAHRLPRRRLARS